MDGYLLLMTLCLRRNRELTSRDLLDECEGKEVGGGGEGVISARKVALSGCGEVAGAAAAALHLPTVNYENGHLQLNTIV